MIITDDVTYFPILDFKAHCEYCQKFVYTTLSLLSLWEFMVNGENNFILAYEIHGSDEQCDPAVLLILQAISVRWDSFYRLFINSACTNSEQ